MKPRLLFVLPALLAALSSHAQTYQPGLLVRSTGDTLRGEIENGFWVEPPAFIRFRTAPGSTSQLFQPRQLRAVSFTGGRYFRYEALPIDHAANKVPTDLKPGRRTDIQTDSLLAEVLIEGPVMLWRVVRPGSTHYLLRRPSQPVLDLAEQRYVRTTTTGAHELVDGNNYHSQLLSYFSDCQAAVAAELIAPFSAAGIVSVVQAYYTQCQTAAPTRTWLTPATAHRRMSLQGGVLAGVRYNYFKDPVNVLPETQGCTDCQPHAFAGLYADFFTAGRTTAVYGELSMSRFNNQYYEYFQSNTFVSYYLINYRAWLASARLGLRFLHPLPHEQQWLVTVCYELNKVFQPAVTSRSGNINSSVITIPTENLGYGKPSLLPNLGLGWRTQRFTLSLDGQFYRTRDESFLERLFGSNFVARAGLSYRLGRNPDEARSAASPK